MRYAGANHVAKVGGLLTSHPFACLMPWAGGPGLQCRLPRCARWPAGASGARLVMRELHAAYRAIERYTRADRRTVTYTYL